MGKRGGVGGFAAFASGYPATATLRCATFPALTPESVHIEPAWVAAREALGPASSQGSVASSRTGYAAPRKTRSNWTGVPQTRSCWRKRIHNTRRRRRCSALRQVRARQAWLRSLGGFVSRREQLVRKAWLTVVGDTNSSVAADDSQSVTIVSLPFQTGPPKRICQSAPPLEPLIGWPVLSLSRCARTPAPPAHHSAATLRFKVRGWPGRGQTGRPRNPTISLFPLVCVTMLGSAMWLK